MTFVDADSGERAVTVKFDDGLATVADIVKALNEAGFTAGEAKRAGGPRP